MTNPETTLSIEELRAEQAKIQANLKKIDAVIAEKLAVDKVQNVNEVLALIKKYNLTKHDLFPSQPSSSTKEKATGKKSGSTTTLPVKYRDEKGNTWTGRGLNPKWLEKEIEAGKKKEDFLIAVPVAALAPAA